jgi:hypothetical protein
MLKKARRHGQTVGAAMSVREVIAHTIRKRARCSKQSKECQGKYAFFLFVRCLSKRRVQPSHQHSALKHFDFFII